DWPRRQPQPSAPEKGRDPRPAASASRAAGSALLTTTCAHRSPTRSACAANSFRISFPFATASSRPCLGPFLPLKMFSICSIEQLAHHALYGELREKAARFLRQAGEKAAARSALSEARAWFEQALGALEALPESRSVLEEAFEVRLAL